MNLNNNQRLHGRPEIFPIGVLFLLAVLLLPRIITTVGAPDITNFFHYAVTLTLYAIALFRVSPACTGLHIRLALIAGAIWLSALVNSAGMVNIFADFTILCQPFLVLTIIISQTWSKSGAKAVERLIFGLIVVHIIMAYAQAAVASHPDEVKGLFLGMGAGAHVAGAVGLSAAVYFFVNPIFKSSLIRWLFPLLAGSVVVISDAKQVLLVFAVSLPIVLFLSIWSLPSLQTARIWQAVKYILLPAGLVAIATFYAIPQISPAGFIYQAVEGFGIKFSVFSILRAYHESYIEMFVGLGPGHTISRLGWMFPTYKELMTTLGGTSKPLALIVLSEDFKDYLTHPLTGSSLYSRTFSWAGIWGDLGIVGAALYLLTWIHVWRRFCVDLLTKFLVANVLVFGAIFSWLEEPAYMGFVAILIGLSWQKRQQRMQATY